MLCSSTTPSAGRQLHFHFDCFPGSSSHGEHLYFLHSNQNVSVLWKVTTLLLFHCVHCGGGWFTPENPNVSQVVFISSKGFYQVTHLAGEKERNTERSV